jgi:hypothetical protein
MPAPTATPIAAVAQIDAAVVSPLMLAPYLMIAPLALEPDQSGEDAGDDQPERALPEREVRKSRLQRLPPASP